MIRLLGLSLLFFICIVPLQAQKLELKERAESESKRDRPKYLRFGFNFGSVHIKNKAVSPLIYQGAVFGSNFSYIKRNLYREMEFGTGGNVGFTVVDVEGERDASFFGNTSFYYRQLYKVWNSAEDKDRLKVGGLIDFSQIFNVTPSFNNNALASPTFFTVFGSIKYTRTGISKPLLFPKKRPAKKREFSVALDMSLLNWSTQYPFVYIDESVITRSDSDVRLALSGFRMRFKFEYIVYALKNDNAISFGYGIDTFNNGGDVNQFGLMNGYFDFSILNRLN